MKLVFKKLEKDGKGTITLVPKEAEDMWHVYNLIQVGDLVRAFTFRNVKTTGPTGSVKSEKVKIVLTIQVSQIDFDTKSSQIRIAGKNREQNKFVQLGAHHTIELALHRKFTIEKERWDAMHLERVDMATDPSKSADLAAVVLQEGIAHICLITSYTTLIRQKISVAVPRKRAGSGSRHGKALDKFYEAIYDGIERHVDFSIVKAVLIASPAFYKDDCIRKIMQHAAKRGNKAILESKNKFIPRHASSGYIQALREVLADPECSELIKSTKAFDEVESLERFFEMMNKNPDQAFYGFDDVVKANEAKAIHELLVTDTLFRSDDIATRRKYVDLVESAKDNGALVKVFSSLHVSGQQLDQLTGVAALLRFPYILEEEEDEGESPTHGQSAMMTPTKDGIKVERRFDATQNSTTPALHDHKHPHQLSSSSSSSPLSQPTQRNGDTDRKASSSTKKSGSRRKTKKKGKLASAKKKAAAVELKAEKDTDEDDFEHDGAFLGDF